MWNAALAVAMAGAMMAATPAATGMRAGEAVTGLNGPRGVAISLLLSWRPVRKPLEKVITPSP